MDENVTEYVCSRIPNLLLYFLEIRNRCIEEFIFVNKKSCLFLWNGILLPKLLWPTVRKNCSSDREKLLEFEAEGREFSNFLRSLEQFIQTVKGQNNFW